MKCRSTFAPRKIPHDAHFKDPHFHDARFRGAKGDQPDAPKLLTEKTEVLIDSHHHLWAYDPKEYGWINDEMAVLKRDFLEAELREIARSSQVNGFVSVQARQTLQETNDLLEIAASEPLIRGVVGWVPLADPTIGETLEQLASNPILKGVRHVVQDEPDDRFLDGDAFNKGVELLAQHHLVYDVLIFAKQLPAAIDFADRHAGLPMVLDHIAKPTIQSSQHDDGWEQNFRELGKREHLTCKFSGVATEIRDERGPSTRSGPTGMWRWKPLHPHV